MKLPQIDIIRLLPWISTLILAFLLYSRETRILEVEILSRSGSFELYQPKPVQTLEAPAKKIESFSSLPETKKVKVYAEAVQKRTYKEVLSDSVQTITVQAETLGILENLKIDYVTKPYTKRVEIPRKRASLYAGPEINLTPTTPTLELKAYLATSKTLYSGGYDINNKSFAVGAAFKLF